MADDEIRVPPDALERMERRAQSFERTLRRRVASGDMDGARAFAQAWSIAEGVRRLMEEIQSAESPPLWQIQAVSLALEEFTRDSGQSLVGFDDD